MSFGIQHHGTQAFRHTVGPISFCFFAQANQPLIGAGMQSQQAWQHTASRYQYAIYVPLFMRGCIVAMPLSMNPFKSVAPRITMLRKNTVVDAKRSCAYTSASLSKSVSRCRLAQDIVRSEEHTS